MFVENGSTWSQQAELTASDGAAGDYFGQSVTVEGGTAVVGANGHKVGSNAQEGAAYVFVGNGSAWSQQAELTASEGAAQDQLGIPSRSAAARPWWRQLITRITSLRVIRAREERSRSQSRRIS